MLLLPTNQKKKPKVHDSSLGQFERQTTTDVDQLSLL